MTLAFNVQVYLTLFPFLDMVHMDRPFFDDISPRNISAVVDETAILRCRVKNKGNRTVCKSIIIIDIYSRYKM